MRTRTTTAGILAVLALTLTACGSGDGKPLDTSASVMCEEFIKKRLKSPGSAEFSGLSDTKTQVLSDKKPWKYKVTGYVDSQNSFGAKVRNNYVCTISTKDDDTWTLGNLDLTSN